MSTPSDKTLRLERTKLTPGAPKGRNTTLIMAMVAGLAAAALAYVFITNESRTAPAPPPTVIQAPPAPVPVLTATVDIPAQGLIDNSKYKIDKVDPSKLPPNAVQNPQQLLNTVAVVPIKANTPITQDMVAVKAFNVEGLSADVQQGYRAMTIALDPQSSVAGFLKPDDYVDVLGTFDLGEGRAVTRVILQKVVLLATGSQVVQTPPSPTGAPTNNGGLFGNNNNNSDNSDDQQFSPKPVEIPNATVMVKPVDAEKLMIAASKGKLMLCLRNKGDITTNTIPAMDAVAVTGRAAMAAPPPPPIPAAPPAPVLPNPNTGPVGIAPIAPPTDQITVIRGPAVQTVPVPQT